MSRILDFADSFESASEPTSVGLPAANVINTPSGNLAATNQQAANNELQSDIDTRVPKITATDNAVTRFDGTTGLVQNSTIIVSDAGDLTVPGDLTVQGTTVTLNTQTLDVEDLNITINKGGNDASAEGAGLTVDRTGTDGSLIYAAAATSKFKIGALGSEVEVADISSAQTLSSKTLAAPRVDVVTLDGQASSPSNPSAGDYKLFVSDTTQKLTLRDSAGTETTVGSGAGGGINYASANSDAEAGTTGFATYKDAAAALPVDGTGGSPTFTITRTTSSPLRATGSFLLTHAASNQQGEGASYDITIDRADRGQQLAISFDYEIASGTYATGDLGIYIYDVTNAVVIQPSGFQVVNVGINARHAGCVFQAASNSTSYRVCWHVATTTATAYTMKIDNVVVGPQFVPAGFAGSDPVSYTPVLAGFGTASGIDVASSRDGSMLKVQGLFTAGTTTAATAQIGLGYNGAASNVADASTAAKIVGFWSSSSSNQGGPIISVPGATYVQLGLLTSSTPGYTYALGNVITSAAQVSFFFEVPIVGWASNVICSDSAATRAVVFNGTNSAGTSIANTGETIVPFVATRDSLGCWNGTDTYTVKVPGDYRFSATLYFQPATYAALTAIYAAMYRNGVSVSYGKIEITQIATGQWGCSIVCLAQNCVAGDTLQLYVANNRSAGSTSLVTVDVVNHLEIEMIQGPSQIQAATTVALKVGKTSGSHTSTGNLQDITSWDTPARDSVGAFNSTTGEYTIQAPGDYWATLKVAFASNATGARQCLILRNGSTAAISPDVTGAVSAGTQVTVLLENCVTGEVIKTQAFQSSGGNLAYTTVAGFMNFQMSRTNGVN